MIPRLLIKLIFPAITLPGFTAKLGLQYLLMLVLVGVDAFMFWYLIRRVSDGVSAIDPAMAALIGTLAGSIATAIAMGIRDLFNPSDDGAPPSSTPVP